MPDSQTTSPGKSKYKNLVVFLSFGFPLVSYKGTVTVQAYGTMIKPMAKLATPLWHEYWQVQKPLLVLPYNIIRGAKVTPSETT